MAKNKNNSEQIVSSFNIIDVLTSITGDIICDGDIRIDGTLKGNIKSNGKIILGETGRIEGSIECKSGDFSGEIKGNVIAYENTALKSKVKFEGELVTEKLAIEVGAVFNGNCKMENFNK